MHKDFAKEPSLGIPIQYGASGIEKRLSVFRCYCRLEGSRLLDVGCGNGAYALVLNGSFTKVHSIDIEPLRLYTFKQRVISREYRNVYIYRMSAEHMAFADNSFDVVTAIEVIEHITRLEVAVFEFFRVLKRGGVLCVAAPNRFFPVETHEVIICGRTIDGRFVPFLPYLPVFHHQVSTARNWTAGELRQLLIPIGFTEVAIDYMMPPFDNWKFGRRFLKPITDLLERTPLRILGVSIIGIWRKE